MALSDIVRAESRLVYVRETRCYVDLRRMHMRETAAFPCPIICGFSNQAANSSNTSNATPTAVNCVDNCLLSRENVGSMAQKFAPDPPTADVLLQLKLHQGLDQTASGQ